MPKRPISIQDIKEFVEESQKPKKRGTSKSTWKKFEIRTASDFGTTRTPLSGMVKTITNSDTLHPKLYIECKLRGGDRDFLFWDSFMERREKGKFNVYEFDKIWLIHRDDFFRLKEEIPEINPIKNVKIYKSILSLYDQTRDRAEIEGKLPLITLQKKHRKGYLIGINPEHLKEIHEILKHS